MPEAAGVGGQPDQWAAPSIEHLIAAHRSAEFGKEPMHPRFGGTWLDRDPMDAPAGTRPDRVSEAMDVIGEELRKLQDPDSVTEEELVRAKENVKGRTVLSMESTLARMNRLGSSVLMGVPLLTLDEIVAAIDAVTLEDVAVLARELFDPARMSAAGVGGSEDSFLSALETVNPSLVAA